MHRNRIQITFVVLVVSIGIIKNDNGMKNGFEGWHMTVWLW